MAKSKYGHMIKDFSFKDYGPGDFRQGTKMAGDFFGYDVCLEYGTYYSAGKMSNTPKQAVSHTYDKVMIWMGTDTYDMGYLGAEVELCLGEEKEKHMITTATAVAVPKGIPHLPADINRMDDRFVRPNRPSLCALNIGKMSSTWPLHGTGPGITARLMRILTMAPSRISVVKISSFTCHMKA